MVMPKISCIYYCITEMAKIAQCMRWLLRVVPIGYRTHVGWQRALAQEIDVFSQCGYLRPIGTDCIEYDERDCPCLSFVLACPLTTTTTAIYRRCRRCRRCRPIHPSSRAELSSPRSSCPTPSYLARMAPARPPQKAQGAQGNQSRGSPV